MDRDFNLINLNDIASVNVHKDASSTALYASSGANVVVIISTNLRFSFLLSFNPKGQTTSSIKN
ncbi:MAG: hypothetical protein JKX79_02430 [Labilibaculum sp.]|nr:hypothetical protein [Labilibaculum sp.]